MKTRIIIVDDHPMFLQGMQALVRDLKEVEIIGTALNGNQALELLKEKEADIVITDITMPDMDGIELTQQIQKRYPHIHVLVLTMHSDRKNLSRMLSKGVSGYLLKNATKDEVWEAIKTIRDGGTYFPKEVFDAMSQPAKTKKVNNIPNLTDREKEILVLIAREYTMLEIAEKLFISQRTVETHRRNLTYKLDVRNTAGLVRYAVEMGLLDED